MKKDKKIELPVRHDDDHIVVVTQDWLSNEQKFNKIVINNSYQNKK